MNAKKTRRRRDPAALRPLVEVIAARLQLARARRALSQEEVARVVSVTQAAISRWESPSHPAVPSAAELARLAAFFGVTADWLIGRADHDQALPANRALLDSRLLDAILACDDPAALRVLLERELAQGGVYTTIPPGAEIVSHAEAQRRVERVERHVRALDEEAWSAWARSVVG